MKYKNVVALLLMFYLLGLAGTYEKDTNIIAADVKQHVQAEIKEEQRPELIKVVSTKKEEEVKPGKEKEKKNNKKTKKKEKKIDKEQLELLAHLIHAEAEGESYKNKLYVGSVVLNRMKSKYYPDTMREVIYQDKPLQYACTKDGRIELEPNKDSYKAAKELLKDGSKLPDNVIFQAEFRQGDGLYCKVDNTYFCYKN